MPEPLQSIFDFSEGLDAARSNADVWTAFVTFIRMRGFSYAGYFDVPGPDQRLSDTIVCNTPNAAWYEHYMRNNYTPLDPRILHLAKTSVPYTLEDVWSCPEYTPEQLAILSEAGEFGIRAIFNVPLRSPMNGPAVITMGAGEREPLDPALRAELHAAAACTDMRLRPSLKQGLPLPHLTDRERECLNWVAAGKTDHAIADILKISAKTVNFHVESAKRKYGVNSRTLAATMAVKAGVVQTN